MYLFKKPFLFPTFMTLFMVVLCIVLGIWQAKRLTYKQAVLKQVEENYYLGPIDLDYVNDYAGNKEPSFLHVRMFGRFLPKYKVFMASRMHDGELGYHLLLPFKIEDSKSVWINLGWVPRFVAPDHIYIPEGPVEIVGHLFHPASKKSFFTPDNPNMIGVDHLWYSYELNKLNQVSMIDADQEVLVFLDKDSAPVKKDHLIYPIPGQLNIDIPNNHLQYLITWFGFAVIFMVMYIIYIKQHKKP